MKKVIFLLMLFFSITVKGLEKEFIDTEYIEVYFNGIVNDVFISNKAVYMEHEGIPLYCLDFSIPISRDNGYDVLNFIDVDQYTNDQKEFIERISYFGYKYRNNTDIYYYLAAQELIWGALEHDVYWTYTRYGGDVIDLSFYKSEILSLYSEYFSENYLFNEYYTMDIGNSYTIGDSSSILPQYEYEYYGNNDISFTPREITVYASNSGVETLKLIRNYDRGFESKIFIEPNYQTIIKTGSLTNKIKILNFVINNSDIYIRRINESGNTNNYLSLKNAVYEIYDINNNFIKNTLTNSDGEGRFPNMPFGIYLIKEVSPSYGYEPNHDITYVDFSWGNVPTTVETYIIPIKKEISITNIYKEDDTEYFDEGIAFEIYKDGLLVDTIITNNLGYTNTYLEFGNYSIKQINSRPKFEVENVFNIEVNEINNNLNYLLYKEIISDNETVEEESIDESINEEEVIIEEVNNNEEMFEMVEDLTEEEQIIIEYDNTQEILIHELPQLFDEKDILENICEKLLYYCLSYLYYF